MAASATLDAITTWMSCREKEEDEFIWHTGEEHVSQYLEANPVRPGAQRVVTSPAVVAQKKTVPPMPPASRVETAPLATAMPPAIPDLRPTAHVCRPHVSRRHVSRRDETLLEESGCPRHWRRRTRSNGARAAIRPATASAFAASNLRDS